MRAIDSESLPGLVYVCSHSYKLKVSSRGRCLVAAEMEHGDDCILIDPCRNTCKSDAEPLLSTSSLILSW